MFIPVGQQALIAPAAYPLVRADAGSSAVNGLGGCGCSGIRSVERVDPSGLGVNPDGLGVNPDGLGDTPALFSSVTGSALLDALLGGAVGWFVAPSREDRMVWAGGGAAAAGLAGTLGLLVAVGAAIYVRKPRTG